MYAASCSGSLYALERTSGAVRWRYDTAADGATAQFHGDPVVTDGLLVIPSDARPVGHVYAFDLATGEVRWKTPVAPGGVTSHLVRWASSVVGLTPTGRAVSLDLATGAERWSVEPAEEVPVLGAHPALAGERVVYGAGDGRVRAVEAATGEVAWSRALDSRPNTAAVVDGDHLLIGTADGSLYRLGVAGGEIAARLELPATPVGTPALRGDRLVLVGAAGQLMVVDRELRRVLWTYHAVAGWSSFQPLVEGDTVVAGTDGGELYAFDLATGRVLWQERLTGTLRGIGRSGGTHYLGTLQGTLYAWEAGEGDVSDPLAWLAGNWRGRQGEAVIEETWSELEGGDRMGMFRMIADGAVVFYEFMTIEQAGDAPPVLRVKHFDRGLVGWEERADSVVFELVEADARRAIFAQRDPEAPTRLTYSLTEAGELTVVLEKEGPEGPSHNEFRFRRR